MQQRQRAGWKEADANGLAVPIALLVLVFVGVLVTGTFYVLSSEPTPGTAAEVLAAPRVNAASATSVALPAHNADNQPSVAPSAPTAHASPARSNQVPTPRRHDVPGSADAPGGHVARAAPAPRPGMR